MNDHSIRAELYKELKLIPPDKLAEVYDLIHFFRIGLEKSKTNKNQILAFAGCWQDMSAEEFGDFTNELKQRRKLAFLTRRAKEK